MEYITRKMYSNVVGEGHSTVMQQFYRDSWVEIQLTAIKQNIRKLREHLTEGKKIIAVVKANAYGHGDIQVAKAALEEGVDGLAVALLDEALKLRHAGIKAPILVLGWVRPDVADIAAKNDITLTVFQSDWIRDAMTYLNSNKLSVHIKADTGMGRIGVKSVEELRDVLASLDSNYFHVGGMFTHYATADEEDIAYYKEQQHQFHKLVEVFRDEVKGNTFIHADNSAAGMRFPSQVFDGVRYGISMYGLYPSSVVKKEEPFQLEPAFSLHSRLVHVKKVRTGEYISYGRTFQADTDMWIGTVPLGYADGWIRKLQGAEVLVNDKRMPIVGRICMDQFMVRLDNAYPVGTKVTLIGKQEENEITMDEIADKLDTINYEVPCTITSRVPRIYKSGEIQVAVENIVLK